MKESEGNLIGDLPDNFETFKKMASTWDTVGASHNLWNTETGAITVFTDIVTVPAVSVDKAFDPDFKTPAEIKQIADEKKKALEQKAEEEAEK